MIGGMVGTDRFVNKAMTAPMMTNKTVANSAIPTPLIQPVSNPLLNT